MGQLLPAPELSVLQPVPEVAQGFFLNFFPTPPPSHLILPNSSGTVSPLETAELIHVGLGVTDKATSPRDTGTSTRSQV